MQRQEQENTNNVVTFGRRKVRPRVCVTDDKAHIRTFLTDAFEDLGFVPCECPGAADLAGVLDAHLPDLVVLGPSAIGSEAAEIMQTRAAKGFDGKVLLLGPGDCPAAAAARELAEHLEIAMLPHVETPFGAATLRRSVASLLPTEEVADPPIDVGEALGAGWLELWYQPQFDVRSLSASQAEGLARMM
jgi:DNA-binding NtrC family response regulator